MIEPTPTVDAETRCAVASVHFDARGGARLAGTVFEPLGEASAGTVILHGSTATPAAYYRRFAEFLATGGVRVLTYDYRGVGGSRAGSLRGFHATMTDWASHDASAAHAFVSHHFGDSPTAIVGHSFGGQLLGLAEGPADAKAIVLFGSQLGWYGHWPLAERLRLGLLWRALIPAVTSTVGYLPGRLGMGEDLPRGVAEEWARWCMHPDYLFSEHPEARAGFARITAPVLAWSATDDDYAPRASVEGLVAELGRAVVHHARVRPRDVGASSVGHFGFFRPRFRQTLWRDTLAFLRAAVGGGPLPTPTATERRRHDWGIEMDDILADLRYGKD
ncbi:MAG: alpha/beta fold hydrolase [Polyangiaceae bacterium]